MTAQQQQLWSDLDIVQEYGQMPHSTNSKGVVNLYVMLAEFRSGEWFPTALQEYPHW